MTDPPVRGDRGPVDLGDLGCAWAATFVLGAIAVIGLLEFGILGLGWVAVSLALIAWKGPRLIGLGGFMSALGAGLVALLSPVTISCANESAAQPGSCSVGAFILWVGLSAAILLGGIVVTVVAIRRSRLAR